MAKRFVFRFDTMLKIRRQREDEQKRVVANRLRQIVQTREQIAAINRQISEQIEAIRRGQQAGRIDIHQVQKDRHWLGHLHKAALEAEARLRFLEARLAQERAVLAEAVKQRRILDKLKEQQWRRFQQEQDRLEMRQSDELTTVRYVFGRRQALVLARE